LKKAKKLQQIFLTIFYPLLYADYPGRVGVPDGMDQFYWMKLAVVKKFQILYRGAVGLTLGLAENNWTRTVTKKQLQGLIDAISSQLRKRGGIEESVDDVHFRSFASWFEVHADALHEIWTKLIAYAGDKRAVNLMGMDKLLEPMQEILARHGLVLSSDLLVVLAS
jgi:hypothetical protein